MQTKAGVYGFGEKAADTVLMISPLLYSGLEPAEERSIYPVYSYNPEKRERDKRLYGEWVAEDLYDEELMSKHSQSAPPHIRSAPPLSGKALQAGASPKGFLTGKLSAQAD